MGVSLKDALQAHPNPLQGTVRLPLPHIISPPCSFHQICAKPQVVQGAMPHAELQGFFLHPHIIGVNFEDPVNGSARHSELVWD